MASSPFEAVGVFEYDSFALLPKIFPINATILLLIHGVLFSTFKQYDYLLLVCNVGWLAIALVAPGAPIAFANLLYNNGMKDNSTYFREILPLLSTANTLVTCLHYFKRERLNAFESIVLILPSTRSMLFTVLACDSIAIDSEFFTEAGLKYSISGAFSSGILLFGLTLFYYICLVKIMYFDTPPRWILSNPMDPEKLLLPAISSSPISFLFFYLSPLFLVSKEMAHCLCCI
ncbi:hypothetical protein KP509_18G046600 [Ceratopteris richardii]|uniref:NADH dehydrogenase subunit 2 n=1 Tax=Ceratopteris richardii TaxID=49495 RepID=A0A8T2SQ19_CERRI|nr:hypothetical protein KP509_18G046600 [Ceratopteris richardii]